MANGWLVAFEGIDGAGTTSQLAPVADGLVQRGHRVARTCEPSTGALGQWLRQQLRLSADSPAAMGEGCLALLFAADRLDHLRRTIAPALARGEVVLTDRYVWSSLAYQSAALPADWIAHINAQAPSAHLNIWFDLPPAVAAARRHARGAAEERFEHQARQAIAAERYATLARQAPAASVLRVDASAPLPTVTAQVLAGLLARLEEKRSSL